MNCPTCKNKKNQPVQVHPVTHQCAKCKVRVDVNYTGRLIIRGKPKPPQSESAPSTDS